MCFTQIEFMYMKQLEKIARDADAKKPIVKSEVKPDTKAKDIQLKIHDC